MSRCDVVAGGGGVGGDGGGGLRRRPGKRRRSGFVDAAGLRRELASATSGVGELRATLSSRSIFA
jgi:hypothetical protein